jgi:hypothetical protein
MIFEQTTPANIWTIAHNQRSLSPLVDVWIPDPVTSTNTMIIPKEISIVDENTVRVQFSQPRVGGVAVTVEPNGYSHVQNSAASIWNIAHNLNAKYVNIDVVVLLNNQYQTILPKNITCPDNNTTVVEFSSPMSGTARLGGGTGI